MRKANCSNATAAHGSKQVECSGHQQQAAAKEATVGAANKWMGSTLRRTSILDQAMFLWESHGIAVSPGTNGKVRCASRRGRG